MLIIALLVIMPHVVEAPIEALTNIFTAVMVIPRTQIVVIIVGASASLRCPLPSNIVINRAA